MSAHPFFKVLSMRSIVGRLSFPLFCSLCIPLWEDLIGKNGTIWELLWLCYLWWFLLAWIFLWYIFKRNKRTQLTFTFIWLEQSVWFLCALWSILPSWFIARSAGGEGWTKITKTIVKWWWNWKPWRCKAECLIFWKLMIVFLSKYSLHEWAY